MKLDAKTGTPRLVETYLVGKGDMKLTSLAILPHGTIAVSFVDKKYDDPATAVLTG